jgi:hypothetical protein
MQRSDHLGVRCSSAPSLGVARRTRHCSLCFRTDRPLEPEHAYPLWTIEFVRAQATGPLGIALDVSGVLTQGFGDRVHVKAPICRSCNGWMNEQIEQAARDLIKELAVSARTRTQLTVAEQHALATWFYKTATMLDASTYGGKNYPPEATLHLHQNCEPPPGVSIWIGELAREIVFEPPPQNVAPPPDKYPTMVVPDSWGTTDLHVLQLIGVVLGVPPDTYRPVHHPLETNGLLIGIWPPREDVINWPPVAIDRPAHAAIRIMWIAGPPRPVK